MAGALYRPLQTFCNQSCSDSNEAIVAITVIGPDPKDRDGCDLSFEIGRTPDLARPFGVPAFASGKNI